MTEREALEESIAHWKENRKLARAGEPFSMAAEDCALCQKFTNGWDCSDNEGAICPVARKANISGCAGTPWAAILNRCVANSEKGRLSSVSSPEIFKKIRVDVSSVLPETVDEVVLIYIDQEIEFLESL